MSEAEVLAFLAMKFPFAMSAFAVLGALVVVGQVVVPLTPTKKDDEAWAKIMALPVVGKLIAALVAFAPIQKK